MQIVYNVAPVFGRVVVLVWLDAYLMQTLLRSFDFLCLASVLMSPIGGIYI